MFDRFFGRCASIRRPGFSGQAATFEAWQVLLPRDGPWLAEYVSALPAFPHGAHDDHVDSTSQALGWLSRRIAAGIPPGEAKSDTA